MPGMMTIKSSQLQKVVQLRWEKMGARALRLADCVVKFEAP
jgi:hypothetical protein